MNRFCTKRRLAAVFLLMAVLFFVAGCQVARHWAVLFVPEILLGVVAAVYVTMRVGQEFDERERIERAVKQSYDYLEQRLLECDKADTKVLRSEKRYRSLFENARDAIFTISPEGAFTSLNPTVEKMGGFSREDWIGRPFSPMVHPEDLPVAMEMFKRTMRGETTPVHILRGHPNMKRPAVMEMTLTPQRLEDGNIVGALGIGRDITERKKAEDANARLLAILESTSDLIAIADPEGHILYFNRAARNALGFGPDEDVTKSVIGDFRANPETHVVLTEGIPTAIREGSWSGETILLDRKGREIPVSQVILSHKTPDGKLEFLSSVMRDITPRKRLEARLLHSQKMETVGKLAGGIAHEFNSILTTIIGRSELLLGDLPSDSPQARDAKEIDRAANRAAMLTNQLLAYGCKQFLNPQTLDLNRVLSGMEAMIRRVAGIDVVTKIVPGDGLYPIRADAAQIELAVMNIVMNAAAAMPKGGRLALETSNVALDPEYAGHFPELTPGDYALLAISDTGVGMSDVVKANAFEPFFTTKDVGEGSGLGLSTCFGILQQSGGHISLYSELGRGTTVKIYLPRSEQPAPTSRPASAPAELPRGMETVLVVEDDPELRGMSATLLQRLGYKVFTAGNGVEALTLRQRSDVGHIDLLFTDIVMPHMSGQELAERVRTTHPHTRILFTTGYTETASLLKSLVNKQTALLQKPFTPSALAHKLREVLDQSPEATRNS